MAKILRKKKEKRRKKEKKEISHSDMTDTRQNDREKGDLSLNAQQ